MKEIRIFICPCRTIMAKIHLPLRQSVSSLTFPQGLGGFHSAGVVKRSSKSSIFLSKIDSSSVESALTDHLSAVLSGVFLGELCSDYLQDLQ